MQRMRQHNNKISAIIEAFALFSQLMELPRNVFLIHELWWRTSGR